MPACPVCGADHYACGGPSQLTTIVFEKLVEVNDVGPLQRYKDSKGNVFSLSAERAKLLGYTLAGGETKAISPNDGAVEDKAVRGPAVKAPRAGRGGRPSRG